MIGAMTPREMIGLIMLFGLIILFILIRIPIAFALGGASFITAWYLNVPMYSLFSACATGLSTFTFMAVPFFMIMGQIMSDGQISYRLIQFCNIVVGRMRGGTAIVNILVSMLFGGISGSSVADVSSIGAMLIPAMIDEGYDASYSVAVTVTSSVQGVIIPPSQNMIFYCIYANAGLSITTLFMCGYIPGVLLGIFLLVPTILIARRRNYPVSDKKSFKENLKVVKDALFGLFAMVIIIVGTTCGICSATEAAALAGVYSLFVTVFIYRNMTFKKFWNGMLNCVNSMTMVMAAIAAASAFRYMLSYLKAPSRMAAMLLSLTSNATVLVLLLVLLTVFLGCFIDMGLLLMMLTPVLVPVITELGMNPYHFGIVFIMACAIGLVTPPVGNAIILGCNIGKVKAEACIKDLLPFVGMMVLCTIILLLFPGLVLGLPQLLGAL